MTNEPPDEQRGDYNRVDLIVAIVFAAIAAAWIIVYAGVIARNGVG